MTQNEQIHHIQKSLAAFSKGLVRDPHFLTAIGTYPSVKLESPSLSGGKYWHGKAYGNHLTVSWGKLNGAQGCSKNIESGMCRAGNVVLELLARAIRKIKEGYRLVAC
jgi:hypothetical protein